MLEPIFLLFSLIWLLDRVYHSCVIHRFHIAKLLYLLDFLYYNLIQFHDLHPTNPMIRGSNSQLTVPAVRHALCSCHLRKSQLEKQLNLIQEQTSRYFTSGQTSPAVHFIHSVRSGSVVENHRLHQILSLQESNHKAVTTFSEYDSFHHLLLWFSPYASMFTQKRRGVLIPSAR